MQLSVLFNLAVSCLLSLTVAEDKHRPGCGTCSHAEAEKKVLELQARLQHDIQTCNFADAHYLTLPGATYDSVDPYCVDGSCCHSADTIDNLWSLYTCYDDIVYPVCPTGIERLSNGTYVVTVNELSANVNVTIRSIYAYQYHWFWTPIPVEHGCDFRISYMTDYSLNCNITDPFLAVSCMDPVCLGD